MLMGAFMCSFKVLHSLPLPFSCSLAWPDLISSCAF